MSAIVGGGAVGNIVVSPQTVSNTLTSAAGNATTVASVSARVSNIEQMVIFSQKRVAADILSAFSSTPNAPIVVTSPVTFQGAVVGAAVASTATTGAVTVSAAGGTADVAVADTTTLDVGGPSTAASLLLQNGGTLLLGVTPAGALLAPLPGAALVSSGFPLFSVAAEALPPVYTFVNAAGAAVCGAAIGDVGSALPAATAAAVAAGAPAAVDVAQLLLALMGTMRELGQRVSSLGG
jgi:hypothetical protein